MCNINKILNLSLLLLTLIIMGCANSPKREPVPAELTNDVNVAGIPEARFWGNEYPKFAKDRIQNASDQELKEFLPEIYGKPHNYLAISGGGAHGAYGAGILYGWTQSGTRPEFTMVTGISTGALAAPFAFLGSKYDELLKEVYTTTKTDDVLRKRWILSAVFSDAIADTDPMAKTIAKYITPQVIEEIAQAHLGGRRLYIGTVNLDASRSVIWSIGAIAISDHPEKVSLIHDIMRASASIPVAFPPVNIEVEAGGKKYIEAHVDGGTGSQVFVYPAMIDWEQITDRLKVPGDPNVYVIRNSYIDAEYEAIEYGLISIAGRTINSLIRTQGNGDLYEIYALCKRDSNQFHLAYIPRSFNEEPAEEFDPIYMTKLFDVGYEEALHGYEWHKGPPGFEGE